MAILIFTPFAGVTSGSQPPNVRTLNADGPQLVDDDVILIDASGGPVELTLLTAADFVKRLSVKKIDATANLVTLTPQGGALIDTAANVEINVPFVAVDLVSDTSNLWVL